MKNVFLAIFIIILSGGSGQQLQASSIHEGEVFVYPESMQGRPLSAGENLRHDRLTAGHSTIPVGTVVRVTNLGNRLSIDVLINDRWTGNSSGIIITRFAASMIGMIKGTPTQVRIEPLSHPVTRQRTLQSVPASAPQKPKSGAIKAPVHGLYFLEFAMYKNIVQAKMFSKKLTKKGAPSKVVQDMQGRYHVISDGYFTSLEDASTAYHLVNNNVGYTPVIKQI